MLRKVRKMHVVEPKAFIIAETGVIDGMRAFLNAIGADSWQCPTDVQSDGELLVEVAGRTCYKSFGTGLNKNLSRVRSDHHNYIGNILETKHGSVLEHATTTVGFVDVSRIFTHELVRHRAGCAYSQESMRFVRLEDVGMYIPDCIKNLPPAYKDTFMKAVESAEYAYKVLTDNLIYKEMPFAKKKEFTSAFRRIAPSGHSTNIVVTANHRAWRHLIELRTAEGAEEEIVKVFMNVAEQFRKRYPAFYQDMLNKEHKSTFGSERAFEDRLFHFYFKNGKI
jgi:thymidylate synthase (FAD)